MALPNNISELDRIKAECKSMVTKRASAAGLAAAVPVPGIDITADIGIMFELLPAINRKFGLSYDQIDQLDSETKRVLLVIITSAGSELVEKVITKQVIAKLLKKIGSKIAVKQVAKYVPFIGTVVSADISFGAMKYLGNSHIDDCYNVDKRYIEKTR